MAVDETDQINIAVSDLVPPQVRTGIEILEGIAAGNLATFTFV